MFSWYSSLLISKNNNRFDQFFLCLILINMLYVKCTFGQSSLNFFGLFPNISNTLHINKHWDGSFVFYSTSSAFTSSTNNVEYPSKILRLYFEPSIVYKHNTNLSFSASISYNYEHLTPNASYFQEWRPWQQIIFKHNPIVYKGRISHRFRLEERFIKNQENPYRLSERLRYQISYVIPLNGKVLDVHEFYINVYNEFYFSLSEPRNKFYSENWMFAGVGYRTEKKGNIEIGPFYQSAIINQLHQRRNLILLQIAWSFNFIINKN